MAVVRSNNDFSVLFSLNKDVPESWKDRLPREVRDVPSLEVFRAWTEIKWPDYGGLVELDDF